MSRTFALAIFLLLFSIYSFAMAQSTEITKDGDGIQFAFIISNTRRPIITDDKKAKLLLENLNHTLNLWSKFQLDESSPPMDLDEIVDDTLVTNYKIFTLGESLREWIRNEVNSAQNSSSIIFNEIKNMIVKVIIEIEKMEDQIEAGYSQAVKNVHLDHSIRWLNAFPNITKMYFNSLFQDEDVKKMLEYRLLEPYGLQDFELAVPQTLNETINPDPLNDQLFNDIANMFFAAIKQFIMVNAACNIASPNNNHHLLNGHSQSWKSSIQNLLRIIHWKNLDRKKEFNENMTSLIKLRLDDGSSNFQTSSNIYDNVTANFKNYNFAIGVYDNNIEIEDSRFIMKGNVYIVDSYNGRNAFIIANQKPPISSQKDYVECPFWNFLNESKICENANGKNISNVVDMIQEKCPGVTDIAIIRMVPHSIIGYVSPKFDRDANAFSISGFGLGNCFHYSIWIANKLK